MKLIVYVNGESRLTTDLTPTDEFSFHFETDKKDEETIQRGYTEEQYQMFLEFHTVYTGKKRGIDTEFENLRKKYKKEWRTILPKLTDAIKAQAKENLAIKFRGGFVPEWPMISVYINQRRWEMLPQPAPKPADYGKSIKFNSI